MKDLVNRIAAALSLLFAARTATTNGTGVDLANCEGATILVQTGTITDGTHTISLQESDDNVTFTNVAAADLIGTPPAITAPDDDKVFKFGYIGIKRYIRVVSTVAGTTTGGVYGASVITHGRRKQP